MKTVTRKQLHQKREQYLTNIAALDEHIEKLRRDRIATLGAVQALDQLLELITPPAPKAAA